MSYKVLRVINISYIEIFRHFFKKNPQALQSSYNQLIEIFKLEHYHYLNSFEEAMVENGNMAELIIYNFETLYLNERKFKNYRNSYGSLNTWKKFYNAVSNNIKTEITLADGIKATEIKDFYAATFLTYDLVQLSILNLTILNTNIFHMEL